MSLEEFLDDSSLNDTVWNENEIDLNAISTTLSNTTSLDLLKSGSMGHVGAGNNSEFGINGHSGHGLNKHYDPPYILKFSNLPNKFSNFEIEDLFRTKFTRFVKFKMFWELNKNPSLDESGTTFEKNFLKSSKVSFVEVYSFRDMDKIMGQWRVPLMDIYAIKVEAAEFADFQNYVNKHALLTSTCLDPAKPLTDHVQHKNTAEQRKSKLNPFGDAKPVDTQTTILKIEETVEKFHIEDTTVLRKISFSEPCPIDVTKVTLLKRENTDANNGHVVKGDDFKSNYKTNSTNLTMKDKKSAQTPKLKLTFSEILQKAAKEKTETSSGSMSPGSASAFLLSIPTQAQSKTISSEFITDQEPETVTSNTGSTSKFVFKENTDPQHRPFYNRGDHRGFTRSRGAHIRRGGNTRGSHKGVYEDRRVHSSHSKDNAKYENVGGDYFNTESFGSGDANVGKRFSGTNRRQSNDGGHKSQNMCSLFRPAAGFLMCDNGNNDSNYNNDNNRGDCGGRDYFRGSRGRGRGRGNRGLH